MNGEFRARGAPSKFDALIHRDKTTDDEEHTHTHIESRVVVEGREISSIRRDLGKG